MRLIQKRFRSEERERAKENYIYRLTGSENETDCKILRGRVKRKREDERGDKREKEYIIGTHWEERD
eukprot:1369480-Amorphochlora_amoeboformis.AAC.1